MLKSILCNSATQTADHKATQRALQSSEEVVPTASLFTLIEKSSTVLLSAREGNAAIYWHQLRSSRVRLAFRLQTIVAASADSLNMRELSCSTKISISFVFKSLDNMCCEIMSICVSGD